MRVKKPVKLKQVTQKNGEGRSEAERIEYVEEEVHVPARINATIFWLRNRLPGRWGEHAAAKDDGGDDVLASLLEKWEGEE